MEIPEWLKQQATGNRHRASGKKPKEKFIDKTLRHVVSFTEDTMFNEITSSKNGFLQKVEPGIKVLTILVSIVALSLQKSIWGISAFFLASVILAFVSRIPAGIFILRLLPVFLLTFFIAMPASLNLIVKGEPIIRLLSLNRSFDIGILTIPQEISITRQGLSSALTLLLRVTASVSLVFLITLTTKPSRLIKAVSSFMPGTLRPIVAISYRYIFFLIRKIEQFIMGFRSRNISLDRGPGKNTGRKWVGSRIGLLFSISLRLSKELGYAMESRGYDYKLNIESERLKVSELSKTDILWLVFSMIFMGAMLWKSLA